MVSDVLAGAVSEIDRYLNDEVFAPCYAGELRDRIVELRNDIDAMRAKLDAPPAFAARTAVGA